MSDDIRLNDLRSRLERRKKIGASGGPATDQSKTKKTPATKNLKLSLDIKLPKLPKVNKKQLVTGLAAVLVVSGSVFIAKTIANNQKQSSEPKDVLSETSTTPQFDTLLPADKSEEAESKLKKVSPPESAPVFAFVDQIDSTVIRVSQQELPEDFKRSPDEQVAKLAESFSATEVINESNPKAYLGTNARGPQTVIFHKNGLLVIINSDKTIDKEQWAEYITKLL